MDFLRKVFSKKGLNKSILYNKAILYNSFVLYGLFLISSVLIMTWLQYGQFTRLAIFAISAYITTHFSKNFVVIMTIALTLTFLTSFLERSQEGFEKKQKEGFEDDENENEKEGFEHHKKKDGTKEKEGFEHHKKKDGTKEKEGLEHHKKKDGLDNDDDEIDNKLDDVKKEDEEKTSSLISNIRASGLKLKDLTSNIKDQLTKLVPDMKRAEGLVSEIQKNKEKVDAIRS